MTDDGVPSSPAHACSYNGVKGMMYISSEHVGFLERLYEQHASVIKVR